MSRFICLCLSLLVITACAAPQAQAPKSERLETVRATQQVPLARELTEAGLIYGSPVFIRVLKQENSLEAWIQEPNSPRFALFKTYPICNFSGYLGPKLREGDKQAPEGFYTVGADQLNPWSKYHLSFNLGFPNRFDEALGRTGSNLMIHGKCESIGCYAMTDRAIEEIYLLVEGSIRFGHQVPVHAFPFRMTPRNMALYNNSQWYPFWANLKQGYDAFELTKVPPKVGVRTSRDPRLRGAKYVFHTPRPTTELF